MSISSRTWQTLAKRWGPLAVLLVIMFVLPNGLNGANMILATNWAIYTLFAMGVCTIFSYVGYPSMAQAGLGTVAAYVMAILASNNDLSPGLAAVAGVLAAAAVAVLIGIPLFRLRGFYFTMTTLLFGSIVLVLAEDAFSGLTGGAVGMSVTPPVIGPFNLSDLNGEYYVSWILVALAAIFLLNLERTRIVRRARAVKGNERVSQLNGIDPLRVKLQMFLLSGLLVGIASVLLTAETQYITPDTLGLPLTVTIFTGLIVGGRRGVWGAIVGALFVVGVNQLLGGTGANATLVYALVLLAVMLVAPGGLVDIPAMVQAHRRRRQLVPDRRTLPAGELAGIPSVAATDHPLVEVRGLEVRFGDVTIVDGVDLEVNSGEVLVIMGPNGAGKTTVVNAISGYVRPAAGEILLDGVDISRTPIQKIRRRGLARTLQTPHVYEELTAWENIAIGLDFERPLGLLSAGVASPGARDSERAIEEHARTLADAVGLGGTLSGTTADRLSFGQRRLLEIGRALGGGSRVLLFDEPMAGLSPAMSHAVTQLIITLAQHGYAIVVVEHNFEYIELMANRVIFMAEGKVVRTGAAQALLSDPRVIEEYVGA